MKLMHKKDLIASALLVALAFRNAHAQTATPGFNTKIPEQILTPDTVQTRIGTLKFADGVPTSETTNTVFDHLDFVRGMEVFLNFIPAASIEAVRLGQAELGAVRSNQAVIWDQLADSNQLYLTMNSDTVYTLAVLDLETDGPTVIEVRPAAGRAARWTTPFSVLSSTWAPTRCGQGRQVPHRS